ncbi:hypothetical protein LSH36_190g02060 [Paralvinella palmiformis]|uniref:Uncharacterized protein n=1 Tax=Paralvinella palmiformis TaxID=53620 RepID=A0AAD9JRW8_9ANNE|nr:hypothetical protein LSH36_190g02060 [Paralvinella palmiformis]
MGPPVPASITHLVKFSCKKSKCRSSYSCRSQNLSCSEMSTCDADEEECDNVSQDLPIGDRR